MTKPTTLGQLIDTMQIGKSSFARQMGWNSISRIYYLNKNPHLITVCERDKFSRILGVDPSVIEGLIDCNCANKPAKTKSKKL